MTSIYGNGGGSFSELPSPKRTSRKRRQLIADVVLMLLILASIAIVIGAPFWVYLIMVGIVVVAGTTRFFLP